MAEGNLTLGGINFIAAYGTAQAQLAAGINEQTGYLLQARNTLAVAEVNAGFSTQYANLQAGRLLKRAEIDSMNYQIAGNTILANLRATNASIRARAAASGIDFAGGSAASVQKQNRDNAMFDVGLTDLSSLTARVLGFEDASAMLQSTELQNIVNKFSAKQGSSQLNLAAKAARRTGGIMATQTLVKGGIQAYAIGSGDAPAKKVVT